MSDEQQPKIHIDSDWKTQAQAEKERLAQQEQQRAGEGAAPGGQKGPPEASFEELVRLLATQALVYLGAFPDPQSGRAVVALDMAQLHIDLLAVLSDKCKGNLSEEESKMLSSTLSELRLAFSDVSAAVSKAVDEGRIQRVPGGAGGQTQGPIPSPGPMGAPPPSTGPSTEPPSQGA